jgi:hypothetical protein
MKQPITTALLITLMACADQPTTQQQPPASTNTEAAYSWTKLLDSAQWTKSYNYQMFTAHDTLWLFHPDAVWFTVNGTDWSKTILPYIINNQAFLDYVPFNDAVYGLGHFEGNIEQYNFKKEIYQTTDFKNWVTLTTTSNLPDRFFYHPFVFNNKIWIIGGEDKNTQYADIWNSADGITWTKQKDSLLFGKRSSSQVVVFNNKLLLLNNDVWSSSDGLNWQKETDEIVKGENLFGYSAVVYDNKVWLLGCNRNGQFVSQVLYSEDGKTWQQQEAPWTPRGGVVAAMYKDKIYMTGGKYGGLTKDGVTTEFIYSNDVWTLERKK